MGHEWLDVHGCYMALGESEKERRDQYMRFVEQDIADNEITLIRSSLQRGQLTGDTRFIDQVEQIIGRRIERRGPGNQPRSVAK